MSRNLMMFATGVILASAFPRVMPEYGALIVLVLAILALAAVPFAKS